MSTKERHDLNGYMRHARKLEELRAIIGGWWSAGEMARAAGVHRQTAYARIAKMVARGDLETKSWQNGAVTVTYYRRARKEQQQ